MVRLRLFALSLSVILTLTCIGSLEKENVKNNIARHDYGYVETSFQNCKWGDLKIYQGFLLPLTVLYCGFVSESIDFLDVKVNRFEGKVQNP